MPLDLAAIQPQISRMIARARAESLVDQLQAACELLRSADSARLRQVLLEREQRDRIPWLVARPAFFCALASPFNFRISRALSISPSVWSRTLRQSIIPAPDWARNSLIMSFEMSKFASLFFVRGKD